MLFAGDILYIVLQVLVDKSGKTCNRKVLKIKVRKIKTKDIDKNDRRSALVRLNVGKIEEMEKLRYIEVMKTVDRGTEGEMKHRLQVGDNLWDAFRKFGGEKTMNVKNEESNP